MKINECIAAIKVCDIILNNDLKSRHLWNIKWSKNIDKKILKQNNGRCYFIVVNDNIYKIGYSDANGGVSIDKHDLDRFNNAVLQIITLNLN